MYLIGEVVTQIVIYSQIWLIPRPLFASLTMHNMLQTKPQLTHSAIHTTAGSGLYSHQLSLDVTMIASFCWLCVSCVYVHTRVICSFFKVTINCTSQRLRKNSVTIQPPSSVKHATAYKSRVGILLVTQAFLF